MISFLFLGIKAFHDKVNIFMEVLANYVTLLGVSPEEMAVSEGLLALYNPAYTKCLGENAGKLDRKDRDKKKKLLEKNVGRLIAWHITHNPQATDAIKGELGVNIPKDTRTRKPRIEAAPVMRNISNAGGLLKMAGSYPEGSRALPETAESMELCWDYVEGGVVPEAKACRHGEPCHGTHGTIDVGAEQRTKQIAVYGRYLNNFPEPGPWSKNPILVVVL